eukprot:CAMPEP_0118987434 /NCGR_PEP_ID=MMETSP1173-20130426/44182_1 /TAXON_ID=1034831 /ORGANISM="Rhizochromulina marina cf, Strain CCMP1243" /LENGTH=58 /DNA_ID=CAMNT_0006938279 /DNA_START=67 /DNA_END=239 /DNA_ORIENTATION=+
MPRVRGEPSSRSWHLTSASPSRSRVGGGIGLWVRQLLPGGDGDSEEVGDEDELEEKRG